MKVKNRISLALATTLFAGGLSAASLDFREEYKHGQEDFAGRVKIGGSFENHYFGVEAKHSGHLGELKRADNEFEYGYNWYPADKWRIQTAMPITFGSTSVTYKPQVRVQYKFDSGLVTKLRYRHEFRNYADGSTQQGEMGKNTILLIAVKLPVTSITTGIIGNLALKPITHKT
nr:oligogalacturonate-specific porin KdgM family protein [Vibrio sonorensis]